MKRAARLPAARHWLDSFRGKNVIRAYARWFGVDWLCAIKELRLLGVTLDESYVRRLQVTVANARGKKQPDDGAVRQLLDDRYGELWGEDFSYIAGRTSAGIRHGVPWDDDETRDPASSIDRDPEDPPSYPVRRMTITVRSSCRGWSPRYQR
jgi:hypothetical protein